MMLRPTPQGQLGVGEPKNWCNHRWQPALSPQPPRTPPGTAPLASLLEDLDTASLESSVPSTPVPRGRTPGSPKKATGQEDDLYYGLREGPDALPEDSDRLFEPEN